MTERKTPTKKEKEALFSMQRGRCMYCGKKMEIQYMHIDHKTAVARSGRDTLTNKQLLCGPCNNRKGAKSDGEFRRRYPFLEPASRAKEPPSKVIPQPRFDERDNELKKRRKPKETSFWSQFFR